MNGKESVRRRGNNRDENRRLRSSKTLDCPASNDCTCRPEDAEKNDVIELDSTSSRSTLKIRARSWPLLIPPGDEKNEDRKPEVGLHSPVAQVRRLLWRHYYPEGGWGYIIVVCSVLVNVLNHGFQLSFGVLHWPIYQKFNIGTLYTGRTKGLYSSLRTA